MSHDSVNERARQLPVPSQQQLVSYVTGQTQVLVPAGRGRGKPATLTALHLCLGIVLCGLEGFGSQLKLWRQFCLEPMGPFAPVRVVDQAVYNRLARAAGAMRAFFEQVSGWMAEQLVGLEDRTLAPWASQVLALDESTLDAVGRWLPELRQVLPGDPRLLAGRISALFDLRQQQWVRVEVWQEAVANCKQQARLLLEGLQVGTLLLFDRGYLSFPWFDELSERQLWSAKWEVVQVQIWCALLLAQLFHGLQVQLAAQEGVEPFDVSIDLLVEVVPRLLQRGIAPLPALGRLGRELGLIRPSTRLQVQVPWVDPSWITPAPPEALRPRETVRYAQRKCAPGPRPSARKAG